MTIVTAPAKSSAVRPGQPDARRGRGARSADRGRPLRRRRRPPGPLRGRGPGGDLDGQVLVPHAGREHVRGLHCRDPPRDPQRGHARPCDSRARTATAARPPGRQRPRGRLGAVRHRHRPRHQAHGRPQRQERLPLDQLRARHGPARLGQLRPARPEVRARLHRQRSGDLDGAQQLATHLDRRPRRRRAVVDLRGHPAPVDVRHGRERRPLLRAARAARRPRPRALLPSVAEGPARPRRPRAVPAHRAGPGLVRREVRGAVRPGEVRPGLRARHGWRDGELGLRHLGRRHAAARHPDLRPAPPDRGDPAPRDGPHVVRRPGDHEVVGRPVAQRGLRVLGRLLGRGRGDPLHRQLGQLPRGRQARGLPRRPGPGQPPHPG